MSGNIVLKLEDKNINEVNVVDSNKLSCQRIIVQLKLSRLTICTELLC
ncbi:hypothetical protein HSX44_03720 [Wolbachia endosymbiont of Onchocerca gibsoni]|nr:hypothetical protein [Wolbachia endosymbiont of Onchocerca gibsoni]MDF0607961.1 hypothetical protein [Wolbachia endosymbiont of Onchocerca gibsoni]